MTNNSHKDYSIFFNESVDMFFVVDPRGFFLEINPAGRQLLKIKNDENINELSLVNFYSNVKKWEENLYLMNLHGFVKDYSVDLIIPPGEQIAVSITASIEKDKSNDLQKIRGTIRNITERVKNEMLLTEAITKLVDANKKLSDAQAKLIQQEKLASIGQLAAGVAHELNNPLGFITSNFNTLKEYMDELIQYFSFCENDLKICVGKNGLKAQKFAKEKNIDFVLEDIVDIFKETMEGLGRMSIIIKSLREFSRIDYETLMNEYDLNKAVENTLIVARNEIKYVADIELGLGKIPFIYCNGDEINQVLLNIIVNAAHAISNKQDGKKGLIKISTFKKDSYVQCLIEDNGPGVNDILKNRIFDPFFTTKDIGKGTGLGLSISYDIVVNRHKGELFVKDTSNTGAVFVIKLPINSPED